MAHYGDLGNSDSNMELAALAEEVAMSSASFIPTPPPTKRMLRNQTWSQNPTNLAGPTGTALLLTGLAGVWIALVLVGIVWL